MKKIIKEIEKITHKSLRGIVYTNEISFLKKYLKPGMTVIDAGACVGTLTILFNNLVYPSGTVIAFEPEAKNFRRLITYVDKDPCGTVCTCIQLALSNYYGSGFLNVQKHDEWHFMTKSKGEKIYVTYIDRFCDDFGIENVDLIKIDVEGQDLKVLKGASNIINKNKNIVLIMEVHHGGMYPKQKDEIFEFLTSRNFKLYDLKNEYKEIQKLHAGCDILAMR